MAALVVIVILAAVAVGVLLIAILVGHGPNQLFSESAQPGPAGRSARLIPFGIDQEGLDLFVRCAYGCASSLVGHCWSRRSPPQSA